MSDEKKEKILIYSLISVVCIIMIIVIILIWTSNFSRISKKNKINTYTLSSYENTMKNYYNTYLRKNLQIDNFNELYNDIQSSYIESLGFNEKEDVFEYLKNNKFISNIYTIDNIELIPSDVINNVFLVTYTVYGEQKQLNIIESSPYKFKIVFMEDENLKDLIDENILSGNIDDVSYDFQVIESNRNSIRLKFTMTNNSEKIVEYDFSYLNSIQLKYGENNYINMSAIANSSTVDYNLQPKSSKSIEILFNLAIEDQVNIQGARINNVKINGNTYTIEL